MHTYISKFRTAIVEILYRILSKPLIVLLCLAGILFGGFVPYTWIVESRNTWPISVSVDTTAQPSNDTKDKPNLSTNISFGDSEIDASKSSERYRIIEYKINQFTLIPDKKGGNISVCFSRMVMTIFSSFLNERDAAKQDMPIQKDGKPVCVSQSSESANLFFDRISDIGTVAQIRYLYPFDGTNIDIRTQFYGYYIINETKSAEVELPMVINWDLNFPEWELANATKSYQDGQSQLHVVLRRKYIYRIITPFLFAVILISIIFIPFVKDLGAVSQISIGMVFGLWTVRQIVLPQSVQWPTILDPIFLAFYALLSISILLRAIAVPFVENMGRERKAAIENMEKERKAAIEKREALRKLLQIK
jgi:hypothetical protein